MRLKLQFTKNSSAPILSQAAGKLREMKCEVEYRDAALRMRLSDSVAFARLNGAYLFSDVVLLSEELNHVSIQVPLRKPIGVSLIGLLSIAIGVVSGQSDISRIAIALGGLTVLIAVVGFLSFVSIVRADVKAVFLSKNEIE